MDECAENQGETKDGTVLDSMSIRVERLKIMESKSGKMRVVGVWPLWCCGATAGVVVVVAAVAVVVGAFVATVVWEWLQ